MQINLREGDITTLTQSLSEAGNGIEDIAELKTAIEHNEKNGGKASFDGETGNWFMRMIGKAAKGSLKAGTELASKVLGEALTKCIG